MAYAIGRTRWTAIDMGSVPCLGLDMRVDDVIRCAACITPVEHYFMVFIDGPHLVGVRCPACGRWRSLVAEGTLNATPEEMGVHFRG